MFPLFDREKRQNFSTRKGLLVLTCMGAVSFLAGCETLDGATTQNSNADYTQTFKNQTLGANVSRPAKNVPGQPLATTNGGQGPVSFQDTPSNLGYIPTIADSAAPQVSAGTKRPRIKARRVDAFVKPLPVPEFIDVVFGGMLETPYVTGPGVAEMTDIVQLRSSGDMSASNFLSLVSGALEDYGVRVLVEDGAYRLIEDSALRSRVPRFIKSRARSETRNDLRPIIQFVEMEAVSASNMVEILNQAFAGKADKLSIKFNGISNYVTLSGLPEDVERAVDIIRQFDELKYAGTRVRRYTPRYWKASELSRELEKVLSAEGWQVTSQQSLTRAILLLPVAYSNDVFIFTKTAEANNRVMEWVRELDRPIEGGDIEQIFIYQVKNVDAQILSETANSVLSGVSTRPAVTSGDGSTAGGNSRVSSRPAQSGRFTVDPLGNRIVFTGTTTEYEKFIRLLEQLDTPAPEVLIEVQIAEVTIGDATNSGVEFAFNEIGGTTGTRGNLSTSSLGRGTAGINSRILSGDFQADINAFASNRRVKVLSKPVLVARSGGAAEIQVGTDVPIITSQGASGTQGAGGVSDILQNISYRKTGILLSFEPIVFSQDRIDLTISQEVSSTVDVTNSSISSPTISNRSINTQLSLEDGSTAILGGLIQDNVIREEKGVPFLKDIPAVGQVFSTDSYSYDRTELVVLITAYVLRGQEDKSAFVNYLSRKVERSLLDDSALMTLNPWNGSEISEPLGVNE